jgi:hypothetical protein
VPPLTGMVLKSSKIAAFSVTSASLVLLCTASLFAGSRQDACATASDCGVGGTCQQDLSMRSDGSFEAVTFCQRKR